MYIQFIYNNDKNGTTLNPYITTTNKNLFKMILKYYVSQVESNSFIVEGLRKWDGKKTYNEKRNILQQFAIEWQYMFSGLRYSWGEVAEWGSFFEEYGKKYGLLREFRENGII